MSGFFGLINNILVDIVHNWIEFQDLIKVDTACCNKKIRVRFLDILSRMFLACGLECVFSKPFRWGQIRQVVVVFHNVKISASSMIHKKLLEQAAFIVSLTIKMKKRNCDDHKLLSHLSLWFQNLKSLKFIDFVPNYDNILKIDPKVLNQLTTLHLEGVYKYSFSYGERDYEENHNSYTLFLNSLPQYCPNLVDVSLLVHYQHIEIDNMCLTFLSRLNHLKRLEICVKCKFSDNDLQLIVDSCHSTIEKLQFWIRDSGGTHLTPQHIVRVIQQCPQLREFTVCYKHMTVFGRNWDGSPKQIFPVTFKTDNDNTIFSWKRSLRTGVGKSNIDITLNAMKRRDYRKYFESSVEVVQHIVDILTAFPVIQQLTLIQVTYGEYLFLRSFLDNIKVNELVLYKGCGKYDLGHPKKLTIEHNCSSFRQRNDCRKFSVSNLSSRVESLTIINTDGLKTPQDILILNPNLKHVHLVDCLDVDRGELMQWWEKSDKTVTITFDTNMRNSKMAIAYVVPCIFGLLVFRTYK